MAVTISGYDQMISLGLKNTCDFDGDTFKAELYNSTNTFTQGNTARSDVSANALSTANGYTNPGQSLSSVTCTQTSGTTKWDAADVTWTASGGSIGPARYCIIYDDTTVSPADALFLSINFGADQTAGDGTNFVITFNASGIFTVA